MLLELYWCEHQLSWFAIQSQLFWETLTWLLVCLTNICTGVFWQSLFEKHSPTHYFLLWLSYCGKYLFLICSYICLSTGGEISLESAPNDVMSREKEWGHLLPLLWLTSCWPSAGWAAAPDWLGSRKGTSECQGNTGTDRGSTLVQTVGTRRESEERERERERKSEMSSCLSISVSWTVDRR